MAMRYDSGEFQRFVDYLNQQEQKRDTRNALTRARDYGKAKRNALRAARIAKDRKE